MGIYDDDSGLVAIERLRDLVGKKAKEKENERMMEKPEEKGCQVSHIKEGQDRRGRDGINFQYHRMTP